MSDDRLRLAAWNCGSFGSNFRAPLDLDFRFAVAVVTECTPLEVDAMLGYARTHALVQPIASGWSTGVSSRVSRGGRARCATCRRSRACCPWPLRARCPSPFSGSWVGLPEPFGSCPAQLHSGATARLPILEGPVVPAGDCNAPIAGRISAHARQRALTRRAETGQCVHRRARDRPTFISVTWHVLLALDIVPSSVGPATAFSSKCIY